MASIIKRGDKWRAEVARKGIRKAATFSTKAEAESWAIAIENAIVNENKGGIPDKSFAELLNRYVDEVSVLKRGERWERLRINLLSSMDIGSVRLADFSEVHVYKWRDQRLTQVSESSVRREWSILSAACTVAVKEWQWLHANPFVNVKKPKNAPPRTRRISQDEIDLICSVLGYTKNSALDTTTQRVGAAFLFAIETAMRAGEIVGLTWHHAHEKYAHLPMTKNGHSRDVPLSLRAREILAQLPRGGKTCFDLQGKSLDTIFRRARDKAALHDLHFHDTRREALSRLAKKLDVMTLAKLSGHMDTKILLNVYYQVKADDVADLLG